MDFNQIIDLLAVRYSLTNNEDDLEALIDAVRPCIKAKARQYSRCVPTTTQGEFEALLYEDVWKACRAGRLANFDPTKSHVLQRLYFFWQNTMYGEVRRARGRVMGYPSRNSPQSLDAMPVCPACLAVHQQDTVDVEGALRDFKVSRPMDYAIISALIFGADTIEIAMALGRDSYDTYARQRVCRARKAFGAILCG